MEVQKAEFEISYIKQLMEDSRRSLAENGMGYIIWGVLIVIGILFNYLRIIDVIEINTLYTWIAVIGLGWIITIFSVKKDRKTVKVSSLGYEVLGGIWASAGVIMTAIGFLGTMTKTIGGYAILPMMSCVLAMAFFVSGIVYKEKFIRLAGVGWFLAAVVFFLWHSVHTLLVFAILMVLFQVVPGIYFYKKWIKQYSNKESV